MKNSFKILILSVIAFNTYAQQATEIDSKSLKLPRYSDLAAIQTNIPSAQEGMVVYNSNTKSLLLHDGNNWGNLNKYNNFRQFLSSTTWIVPVNVTSILVEVWGSGGGGNGISAAPTTVNSGHGSGDGGGGYAKALFTITSGTTLTITVGAGGAGGSGGVISPYVPAQNGISSVVASPSQSLTVTGGSAALNTSSGNGAITFTQTNLTSYIFERGKNGQYQKTDYKQSSATDFWEIDYFGNGGDGGNSPESGGEGGSFTRNMTTLAAGVSILGSAGQSYGGGGGGGFPPGGNGAGGAVIIYY